MRIRKTLALTIICFLLPICLISQEGKSQKSTIRGGINRAFFEGDTQGTNLYAEYSYSYKNYFAIAPAIMSGLAYKQTEIIDDSGSSPQTYSNYTMYGQFYALLTGRLTPFPKRNKWAKIDIGGFYQYLVRTDGSGGTNTLYSNYYEMSSGSFAKGSQYGALVSLSLNLTIKEINEIGIKADRYLPISGSYYSTVFFNQVGIYYGISF